MALHCNAVSHWLGGYTATKYWHGTSKVEATPSQCHFPAISMITKLIHVPQRKIPGIAVWPQACPYLVKKTPGTGHVTLAAEWWLMYLSQCWRRFILPHGVTRRVKTLWSGRKKKLWTWSSLCGFSGFIQQWLQGVMNENNDKNFKGSRAVVKTLLIAKYRLWSVVEIISHEK